MKPEKLLVVDLEDLIRTPLECKEMIVGYYRVEDGEVYIVAMII